MQKWSQRISPKDKSKKEFLATKQITVLEHPAYSPDLAPSDFFSVPEDKGNIERKTFRNTLFHPHRQVGACRILHAPTCL